MAGQARSRVDALIHLLGDESASVHTAAWKHLEALGADVLPHLSYAVAHSPDPRVRSRAREFLREWRRREVLEAWVHFCNGGDLDLEEGTFLIVRSEFPEANVDVSRRILDEYAKAVRQRIAKVRTVDSAVQTLVRFLHEEKGFRGNLDDYHNADNSYLNRVLEEKTGIPISLSALYLLVARRLSVPLFGVGMPQHFLLKFSSSSGRREVFVDPFHGSGQLSAADCRKFLTENDIPFDEKYFRAVSDREILSRMLANLLFAYHGQGDQRRLNRITAMLRLLE